MDGSPRERIRPAPPFTAPVQPGAIIGPSAGTHFRAAGHPSALGRVAALCGAFLLAALVFVAPVHAAGPLTWGSPVLVDTANKPRAISCPTTSFCVAGGDGEHIAITHDPVHGPWTVSQIAVTGPPSLNNEISDIACLSASDCVAVDHNGHVMTTTNAGAGGGAWTATQYSVGNVLVSNDYFTSLSCPSVSLCAAVDNNNGGLLVSASPLNSASWTWKATPKDWTAASCTASFCVATSGGDVYYTSQPTSDPSAWTKQPSVDPNNSLGGIVCVAAPLCVSGNPTLPALGANVFTTTNPAGGASAWNHEAFPEVSHLTCATTPSLLCTASHYAGGYVLASTNPAGGLSTWTAVDNVGGQSANVSDVSCPTSLLCVAALNSGYAVAGAGADGGTGGGGGGGGGNPPPGGGPIFGSFFGGVVIQGTTGTTYVVGPSGFALYVQVSTAATATFSGSAVGAYSTATKVDPKRIAIVPVTVKLKAKVRTKVKLKLTRRARAVLAKRRRIKVRLTIRARTAAGAQKTTTKLVTLVKKR